MVVRQRYTSKANCNTILGSLSALFPGSSTLKIATCKISRPKYASFHRKRRSKMLFSNKKWKKNGGRYGPSEVITLHSGIDWAQSADSPTADSRMPRVSGRSFFETHTTCIKRVWNFVQPLLLSRDLARRAYNRLIKRKHRRREASWRSWEIGNSYTKGSVLQQISTSTANMPFAD